MTPAEALRRWRAHQLLIHLVIALGAVATVGLIGAGGLLALLLLN